MVSLGGAYITRKIAMAQASAFQSLISSNRINDDRLIVIIEAQPKSFVADEDYYTSLFCNSVIQKELHDDDFLLVESVYMKYILGDNVEKEKNLYVNHLIGEIKKRRNIHLNLEKRLKYIIYNNWVVALERQAAHVFENFNKEEWISYLLELMYNEIKLKHSNKNINEKHKEYKILIDPLKEVRPIVSEAELKFSGFMEQLTKTLKSSVIIEKNITARSLKTIGFSGANKIIGIVKFNSRLNKEKVVYGTVPIKTRRDIEKYSLI